MFPAGCQALPVDKSNLPYSQPAPAQGQEVMGFLCKKPNQNKRNSHACLEQLAGELMTQRQVLRGQWVVTERLVISGPNISVKLMSCGSLVQLAYSVVFKDACTW